MKHPNRQLVVAALKSVVAALTEEEILDKIGKADIAKLGFGGNCFTMAIALKKTIIPDGQIVVAANKYIYEHTDRMIGHAAVQYDGAYYDAEGAMDKEDLLEIASLPPDDPEYIKRFDFEITLEEWDALAEEAVIVNVDESDLVSYTKPSLLKKLMLKLDL